jgi:hypothetical protein
MENNSRKPEPAVAWTDLFDLVILRDSFLW